MDVTNEHLVNEAVKQLAITEVIVAHRPETIASADRVLVVHGGQVVQAFKPARAEVAAWRLAGQAGARLAWMVC